MTLFLSVLLGIVFVVVVAGIALGIVTYARDHCDETLSSTPTKNTISKKKQRPRDSHGRFTKSKKTEKI